MESWDFVEIFDLSDVKDDELKALQTKNLEILEYFDKFCTSHNLRYSLLGGTLIGAIRHQGFIPWDDDVDLMMPREDYEKLFQIWNQEVDNKQYVLVRSNLTENYHDAGIGIKDTHTTFINKHSINDDVIHSIGIEIMPIDGAPKTKIKRIVQLYNAFIFALFNTQRLPDNKGKVIRIVTGIIYALIPGKKTRYNIWRRAEKRMTRYLWEESNEVTELIGSIKGMKILHPKEDFETMLRVPFEHLELPVIKGYDRYLTLIFGNYMELPPKQDRVAKHNVVYVNTEHPYHEFKHKYYCVKD